MVKDVWWERDLEGNLEGIWKGSGRDAGRDLEERMNDSQEFAPTGMRGKKGVDDGL